MLRRFAFSIFPALLFYAFIFLFRWDEKQKFIPRKILFNFVFFAFLISNLTVFWQFFPFSENKNLLEETQKISREFESNDLVLVDRLASGSGWSMLNGPMSFLDGKNAVYFFNPYDFDKIDRKVFSKIYLVVSNENIQTYSEFFSPSEMEFVRNYSLETERIFTYGNKKVFPLILPEKQTIKVQGKIFELKGR
jgi:hypothetical protein